MTFLYTKWKMMASLHDDWLRMYFITLLFYD